jgi:hypothetical protein
MKLDPHNRDRCRFHLGYGNRGGIPAADVAILEQAMDTIDGNYQYNRLIELLDECDNLYTNWRSMRVDDQVSKELISGDLNRSVIRTLDPAMARKQAWARYMDLVREITQNLWVPNYRDDVYLRYRFERGAGDYLNLIPGVADTAIGATHLDISRNGGGFGLPIY